MAPLQVKKLNISDSRGYTYALVDVDLLVPDSGNPRIPPQESRLDTILAVMKEDPDGIYNLARDIVALGGHNPAELLNVTEIKGGYLVKEGNRRIVARGLLRNPEQLRDHVSSAELKRWRKLAEDPRASELGDQLLVVIGRDHEPWIDRRHLGIQGGIGTLPWNAQARARRDAGRTGTNDRTLALLDSLKASYPDRFQDLEPPKRTFTTFVRVIDSQDARAHIGIDVDEAGNVVLRRGEQSLRILERVLQDLRKKGEEKLTSRRIDTTTAITNYLTQIETEENVHTAGGKAIKLKTAESGRTSPGKKSGQRRRVDDILKSFNRPAELRLRKIFDEIAKARRNNMPNAAMVLIRILLELTVDHYANVRGLTFAGDKNTAAETDVKEFYRTLNGHKIDMTKSIRNALKFAGARPMSLSDKLEQVVRDLIAENKLGHKEGTAKLREIRSKDVLELLNDAVHRLQNAPSPERVEHTLEVIQPLFNAMTAE